MPFYVQTLESLSLFLQCQNAKNDPFYAKKVHGFPVRTPICHIVPISHTYRGGVGSTNERPPPPPIKTVHMA